MRTRRVDTLRRLRLLLLAAVAAVPAPARADVTLDRGTRHQTFDAWEATGYAAQDHAAFASFRDEVMRLAATELGITRLRLEVRAGVENDVDYYQQWQDGVIDNATWRGRRYTNVDDDGDPGVIDASGFHFTELDQSVAEIVLPLRAAVQAAGGTFEVNLCYVAFTGQNASGTQYLHDQAAEYGELVEATYAHLEASHGFVPDYWEMILEPDNTTQWTGMVIGQALVAAGQRIQALGHTPRLIAPSNTNMTAARNFFDAIAAVPGALDHLAILAYHRYGGTGAGVAMDMAERAQTHGIKTAMLEWIGAAVDQVHEDLKLANVSAWQQFTLASAGGSDDGGSYLRVDASNPSSPVVTLGSRSRLLRQYMKYIRPGAVRIEAASDDGAFDPIAFENADDTDVVVVKASAAGSFDVHGLRAGSYGVVYTTSSEDGVSGGEHTLAQDEAVSVSIPAAGVITIFGRAPASSGGPDAGGPLLDGSVGGSGGSSGSPADAGAQDSGSSMSASGAGGRGGAAGNAGTAPPSAGGGPDGAAPGATGGTGPGAEGGASDGDASGCGCRVVAAARSPRVLGALLALPMLALVARVRRRARRPLRSASP